MAHLLEIQAQIIAASERFAENPSEVNRQMVDFAAGQFDKYYAENAADILSEI